MRTQMSLRLLCLLDLESSPTLLSTLLLFALSKPVHPLQKDFLQLLPGTTSNVNCNSINLRAESSYPIDSLKTFLVEMRGVEPLSRTLFSLLHTAITYI